MQGETGKIRLGTLSCNSVLRGHGAKPRTREGDEKLHHDSLPEGVRWQVVDGLRVPPHRTALSSRIAGGHMAFHQNSYQPWFRPLSVWPLDPCRIGPGITAEPAPGYRSLRAFKY